jgi:hypothetical protein
VGPDLEETMTVQPAPMSRRKSVLEHGACFGTFIALLTIVAVGLQWVLHLVP